jgi:hypothetical protein
MGENPNNRMATGVKVFLWGIGIVLAGILAIALPALLRQREKARTQMAIQKAEALDQAFYARALKMVNKSVTFHAHINLMCRAYGAPHISIVRAADYPDMALITIVWPTVLANQLMINPDETRPGAVPPMMQRVRLDTIPVSITNWNCRVDDHGNILMPPLEQDCLPDAAPDPQPMPDPSQPQTAQAPATADASTLSRNGSGEASQQQIPVVPITSLEEILPRPELVYPAEARSANLQGAIQVEVTIAANGVPTTAVSQNGPVILRTAAENWEMERRFKPPVVGGLNQPVKVINNVTFAIEPTGQR